MAIIKLRRGTTAQWTAADPVLNQGEAGYDLDAKRLRVGDGVNRWSLLESFVPESVVQAIAQSYTSVVATSAEVTAGVLDNRYVSPLKLQQRLAAFAQPLSANLSTLSGVASGTFGRTLLTHASADATRSSLGVSPEVRWSGSAWGARPTGAPFGVVFLSTNDVAATNPPTTGLVVGDRWRRHPGVAGADEVAWTGSAWE